ncbi:hypothetical protein SAMN05660461_5677 [Chitinophaga ginsengisegetis]|uniref:Ezrin/radixin/moesin C-terminal domain-containing protein n=2 Tax=Chitinophagaceae TaxID=563835 RepID=A0A1T5PAM6_9BACT|nr:uncharacterized protein YhaN [Chitinophaga ginsengisegetis]SKD09785.1 hypothetical protein SAMN05660461_5677 [Chitinophaga ginsengisegetis]
MMKLRKVLTGAALCCMLFFSASVLAQSGKPGVTDITFHMLTWVKHLDNDVDKYFKREKGEQLNQQLEALKQELNNYRKARKTLSDSLFRNNIAPGKKDDYNLEALKVKMSAVMEKLRGVTDLVNPELQAEGDKLNEEIYNALYSDQPKYLSYLEAFLGGLEVTKKDLALDGSTAYSRLGDCVNIIASLEGKINRKMGQ